VVGVKGMRFSSVWICAVAWYCVYKKYPNPHTTMIIKIPLNIVDDMLASSVRRTRSEFSILFMSTTLMRWFIAVACVEKLQRFPNPYCVYARTDADAIRMN
jgi:hypothetical protein